MKLICAVFPDAHFRSDYEACQILDQWTRERNECLTCISRMTFWQEFQSYRIKNYPYWFCPAGKCYEWYCWFWSHSVCTHFCDCARYLVCSLFSRNSRDTNLDFMLFYSWTQDSSYKMNCLSRNSISSHFLYCQCFSRFFTSNLYLTWPIF